VDGVTGSTVAKAASLRRLELLVTRRLDGLLAGDYRGILPGQGTELAEGRPYVAGDDVRRIDWSLTARMNDPHVRTTEADRELTTWVVVDRSASLDFGTANSEKRDLVLAATAAVGFLTARGGGNRVGGMITGGERRVVLPPRSGRQGAHALLHRVDETPRGDTPPAEDATVGAALTSIARMHQRRGLVVVVSDFLEKGWEQPLRRVALRHQTLALVTVDPRERTLPAVGLLTLVDPETGRRLEVQTSSPKLRARYEAAAAEQDAHRRRELRRAGCDVIELSTDRDWLVDIVRHVGAGRRRQGALSTGVRR
jgi:uncharacterized protein (DUF58 family)